MTETEKNYANAIKVVSELEAEKAKQLLKRSVVLFINGISPYPMAFTERWISINLKIHKDIILWGHNEPMMEKLKRVISAKILL